MKQIILVQGLPGSGKTTLSAMMAPKMGAARLNADYVRRNINQDLGFSVEDRILQAQRMGFLCNLMLTGKTQVVVVDFINPTPETRAAFNSSVSWPVFSVLMSTIDQGRFDDTNNLYVPPSSIDYEVSGWCTADQLNQHAELIAGEIRDRLVGCLRRYHIRFNTECNKDPSIPLKWRIIDLDSPTYSEKLASSFHISGSQVWSGMSYDANGVEKWNVEIQAALYWEGTHANFIAQ